MQIEGGTDGHTFGRFDGHTDMSTNPNYESAKFHRSDDHIYIQLLVILIELYFGLD